MSFFALLLVLTAACCHATWNYHLKKANCGRAIWWLVYLLTSVITIPLLLLWDPQALTRITPTGWFVILISAPIHVVYALVLQIGYKKSDYSIVYPTARGAGPLITVLSAVVILGDAPSLTGWCGIFAILAGVVLLTLRTDKGADLSRVHTGIFWGLLTGVCIAGYSFCDAWAVQRDTGLTPASFYFPSITGVCIAGYSFCDAWAVQRDTGLTPASFYFPSIVVRAIVMTPFMLAMKDWREQVRSIWKNPVSRRALWVVTVGSPGGYILVLCAMTMAPLAYVAPTREVGMMVGVIVGAILLKEHLSLTKISGLVAMVAGVLLIAFAH